MSVTVVFGGGGRGEMFIHANHRIVCSVVTQMCDFATLLTRFTEMAKRLMKFDHIDLLQSRNMSHYRGKASLGILRHSTVRPSVCPV